jgi:vitamin B12 transporter
MEEVVVPGRRDFPGTGRADPVAFATVIQVDDEAHRAQSIPDLLRHAVGVDVRGFGGLGGFATLSIRGSTAEQVPVFLDGVLLTSALSGSLDLGSVPLAEIERLEVYRGSTPPEFGAAGPGGVLNLVTRSATARPRSTFTASFGSFGTFEFSLSHSGSHPRGDFLALAHGQRSDGSFPFLDNNGTPLNPTDDEVTRRRNNGFFAAGGLLKTSLRFGERQRLSFVLEGSVRVQGVAGIDALQSERAGFETRRIFGKADFEAHELFFGARLRVSAFATHGRDAFQDPAGETGLGPREVTTSILTPGLSTRLTASLGSSQVLAALLEYRHDGGVSEATTLGRPVLTTVGRHAVALSVEDRILLWKGRMLLNPSVRLDLLHSGLGGPAAQEATHAEVGGKLGLRLSLAPGLSWRGNVGRFFRPPTLVELFGDTGAIRGNPHLRPELGYTWDTGLTLERRSLGRLSRALFEAVYFQNRFEDLVVFLLNAQGAAIAQNQAAATVRGVEISSALELGIGLAFSGSYTFQRALSESPDASQGKLLPGRPQHKVSVRMSLTQGDWRFFYDLLVVDGNYVDRLNRVLLEARVLHAAGFAWRALSALTVSGEVQNFTDNRAVDLYRFPLPGRSFFAKLSVKL